MGEAPEVLLKFADQVSKLKKASWIADEQERFLNLCELVPSAWTLFD